MSTLALTVLNKEYAIHRLAPDADIPAAVFSSQFYSITKTEKELSVVCEAEIEIDSTKTSSGWGCLKVIGTLDFNLTGILAGISSTLANAKISLFAISTFDTDYFLVKRGQLSEALLALKDAGYLLE